ncbi:unknown [Bacteroides sp. CAG:709]|nr:unknown [Bacteroides sp. CAG:709]
MATRDPGILRENFGTSMMISTLRILTPASHQFIVSRCLKYSIHLPIKSPGTVSPPKLRPNTSAICVVKIVTAIPLVNPTTTG